MIIRRDHLVGVVVGVLGDEPTGQQEGRPLIPLVEALRGRDLIGERSRRLDRVRVGLGSQKGLLNAVEIVIVRSRRDLTGSRTTSLQAIASSRVGNLTGP